MNAVTRTHVKRRGGDVDSRVRLESIEGSAAAESTEVFHPLVVGEMIVLDLSKKSRTLASQPLSYASHCIYKWKYSKFLHETSYK